MPNLDTKYLQETALRSNIHRKLGGEGALGDLMKTHARLIAANYNLGRTAVELGLM